MNQTVVKAAKHNAVLVLTLNRPKAMNALNRQVLQELEGELERADQDEDIKVVMITGEGEKAFAAGADISEFIDLPDERSGRAYSLRGKHVFAKIEQLSKPVIAAVNGYALGGGLELALSCDIRIASDRAKFGFPEVTLGLIPGFGGTARSARFIGHGAAMHLIASGETICAEEAKQLGLVERLVSGDHFREEAVAFVEQFTRHTLDALTAVKKSVRSGMDEETRLFGALIVSEEAKGKIQGFLNKR